LRELVIQAIPITSAYTNEDQSEDYCNDSPKVERNRALDDVRGRRSCDPSQYEAQGCEE
jgi:hypothetical protein